MSARTKSAQTTQRRTRTHIGPWQLGRTLGRGSSGRVRLAKHSESGQLAAVKIVPKTEVEGNHGIEREVIIMKLIEHPNIMGLYDVWENKGELYLVLEYIEGGELFDYLVRRGRLNEREAVYYFRQICSGVQYCHQFNICHRDLKPENLLLDRHRNIKIADFGMAALETAGKMLETSCGSPHYASPEIVAGRTYHGAPSDIWSCGVILFALVTGHLPFDDDNIRVLLRKVQAGRFSIPSFVGPEARDLISRMLRVEPGERISMEDIFKHPLLRKYPHRNVAPVQPPTLDASHPVANEAEINPEILRNLMTLWHHTSRQDIIKSLLAAEPNPEKTFYCLLDKYRQAHRKPQPKAVSSPISRSGSRASIRSKRSGSSRSLRAIPRQSRVSMASIHSRVVAERPAPKAPTKRNSVADHSTLDENQHGDPVHMDQEDVELEIAELSGNIDLNQKDVAKDTARAGPTMTSNRPPTNPPASAARGPHSSFAELIDKAFGQRSASVNEPKPLVIDERRTVSDGDLLPMIFEEGRFMDAPEKHKVPRKPVSQTSSQASTPIIQTPTTATGPTAAPLSTGSAKTGPVMRPKSMVDPNQSELSVARRQDKRKTTVSEPVPNSHASPELERKHTKRLADFAAPATPAMTQPSSGAESRKPLSGVNSNIYPPLITEQKQKVSILRRFTPKRSKTPATVTSADYEKSQTEKTSNTTSTTKKVTGETAAASVGPSSRSKTTYSPEDNNTKQNWLFKMLNLGSQDGPTKTLLSTAQVGHLRTAIVQVLQEWTQYGLVFEGSGSIITATINSKNAFKLRMSRFTIRVQSLESGSSAVCTQVRGAQMSYLRFVGELERVLGNKNLLGPPDVNVS